MSPAETRPSPHPPQPEHELALRYLLGKLGEEERDRLEARLLDDTEAFEAVLAAEDELVDDYVAGDLSRADRAAFESRLLASDRIRQRLGFARSLRRLTTGETAAATARAAADRPGWRERLGGWLEGLRLVPSPAMATALAGAFALLLVASGWLGWRTVELDGRLERLDAQRHEMAARGSDLEHRLAAEGRRADHAASTSAAELAAAQQRNAELAQQLADLEQAAAPAARRPLVASFVLSLATRSAAAVPELAVPRDAETVRLQLDTGGTEDYPSFRARLLAGDTEVWSRSGLHADGSLIEADVPAAILTPGRYELLLEGVPGSGATPELVGAFELRARQR